jgi:hypothetical protein
LGLYPSRSRVLSYLTDMLVSEHAIKEALTYLGQNPKVPGLPYVSSSPSVEEGPTGLREVSLRLRPTPVHSYGSNIARWQAN